MGILLSIGIATVLVLFFFMVAIGFSALWDAIPDIAKLIFVAVFMVGMIVFIAYELRKIAGV